MTLKTGRALGFAAALLLGSVACSAENQVGTDNGEGGDKGNGRGGATGTDASDNDRGGASGTVFAGKGGAGQVLAEAWGLSGDASLGQLAVATTSKAGPATLLDARDGAPLRILKPTSSSSDPPRVRQAGGVTAVGTWATVWIFKADGTLLRAIPEASLGDLSRDGKVLISGGDGGVRRFDVASGLELLPSLQGPPVGDAGVEQFGPVAISPDGAHVAAYGSNGVYVWRTSDGARLAQIATWGQVALSATELAVGSTATVTVYSLAGQMLTQYPAEGASFLAYSPDGNKLAYTTVFSTGTWAGATLVKVVDRQSGVAVANLFDDRQARRLSNGSLVMPRGLAFIDGAVGVVWSDRRVTLFGATDGLPIWSRVLDE